MDHPALPVLVGGALWFGMNGIGIAYVANHNAKVADQRERLGEVRAQAHDLEDSILVIGEDYRILTGAIEAIEDVSERDGALDLLQFAKKKAGSVPQAAEFDPDLLRQLLSSVHLDSEYRIGVAVFSADDDATRKVADGLLENLGESALHLHPDTLDQLTEHIMRVKDPNERSALINLAFGSLEEDGLTRESLQAMLDVFDGPLAEMNRASLTRHMVRLLEHQRYVALARPLTAEQESDLIERIRGIEDQLVREELSGKVDAARGADGIVQISERDYDQMMVQAEGGYSSLDEIAVTAPRFEETRSEQVKRLAESRGFTLTEKHYMRLIEDVLSIEDESTRSQITERIHKRAPHAGDEVRLTSLELAVIVEDIEYYKELYPAIDTPQANNQQGDTPAASVSTS